MTDWGPAAITGALAVGLNQWVNWRKERREARADQRADQMSELQLYKLHMDGVITALERRVVLAEENEKRCTEDCSELKDRIADQERTIDRLSRRLAAVNGGEK
jgi:hypothetical protein